MGESEGCNTSNRHAGAEGEMAQIKHTELQNADRCQCFESKCLLQGK